MATIKTLAAILPLLAFASAAAEESVQPAYVMPQIPSEAEKIAALKLGYRLNGNRMVGVGRMIDLTDPAVLNAARVVTTAPTVPVILPSVITKKRPRVDRRSIAASS